MTIRYIDSKKNLKLILLVDSSVRLKLVSLAGSKLTLYGSLGGADNYIPSKKANNMIKIFNAEKATTFSLDLTSEMQGFKASPVEILYFCNKIFTNISFSE